MTCVACKKHVADALLTLENVKSANVKHRRGYAIVDVTKPIPAKKYKEVLQNADYDLASAPEKWVSRDRNVWRDSGISFLIICAVLFVLSNLGFLDLGGLLNTTEAPGDASPSILLVIVGIGVIASVSTCMAMVGGLVLGVSSTYTKHHPDATKLQLLVPQFTFNAGRIIGFGLFGLLIGSVGGWLVQNGIFFTVLSIIVAIAMFIIGVRLSGISPRLGTFSFTLPANIVKLIPKRLHDGKGLEYQHFEPFLLGALSFFLPCGFTQAVQLFALATGNPLFSGLIMATFALGTTPGLLFVSFIGTLGNAKSTAKDIIFRFIGTLVIILSLVNFLLAINPYVPVVDIVTNTLSEMTSGNESGTSNTQEITSNVQQNGGNQSVTIETMSDYSPKTTIIKANTPTKITFKRGGIGCSSNINLASIGKGKISTMEKDVVVDDVNLKPGTYNYSCTMGMYKAKIVAVEK